MKEIVMPIAALKAASAFRPDGYLEDAIASGRMSDDGRAVIYTQEQYDSLFLKYRGRPPLPKTTSTIAPLPPAQGPGTELKKLLRTIGITATPNCSCNARARKMDEMGCEWCETHLDEIVGWLREEATKRKLLFVDMAGRLLVRRAIANARRAAAG